MTAGYTGTPLPNKLGIGPGSRVLVDGGPLLELGVDVHRRPGSAPYDVIVLFCPRRSRLVQRWGPLSSRLSTAGRLWVCWPKRSSGLETDLSERGVRDHGLAQGLVDVKVCAVDEVWSGLAFVRRVADREPDVSSD